MWLVVEFPTEGTVEAIPNNWVINSNLVFWPDGKKDKVKQLILKCAKPEAHWKKFSARILGKGKIYDTFHDAVTAVSIAEYSSDINISDCEKRKIKPKKIYSSSSDDSDVEDDEEYAKGLPSYGSLLMSKKSLKKGQTIKENNGSNVEGNEEYAKSLSEPLSMTKKPLKKGETIINGNNDSSVEDFEEYASGLSESQVIMTKKSLSKGKSGKENTTKLNLEVEGKDVLEKEKTKTLRSCHGDVIAEMAKQFILLNKKIDIVLRQIEDLKSAQNSNDTVESESIFQEFPIKTLDELTDFENKLLRKECYEKMVNIIYRKGGHNAADCVKRSLSFILSNMVQSQLNWEGQKNKKSFKTLSLCRALFEGILRSKYISSTEAGIEKAVKNFLRHASDRVKTETSFENKNPTE